MVPFHIFRCRVSVHWLCWCQPTLVALSLHRIWHPFSCHVDYQRVSLLRNDLFMRKNRFHRKRALYHRRIWPVHKVVAGIPVRFQVRKNVTFLVSLNLFWFVRGLNSFDKRKISPWIFCFCTIDKVGFIGYKLDGFNPLCKPFSKATKWVFWFLNYYLFLTDSHSMAI